MNETLMAITKKAKEYGFSIPENVSDMRNTLDKIDDQAPSKVCNIHYSDSGASWYADKKHTYINVYKNGIISYTDNNGCFKEKEMDILSK